MSGTLSRLTCLGDTTTDSLATQSVKAVIMFSEAVSMSSHFQRGMFTDSPNVVAHRYAQTSGLSPDDPAFQAKFVEMDNKLERYKRSLHAVMERRKIESTTAQRSSATSGSSSWRFMRTTRRLAISRLMYRRTGLDGASVCFL